MKRITKRPLRYQKGAVAIIVGLCIFVLIGFLGLVVDLGRLFITKTELQNAADACALAAARELNGQSDALTRADNAGITIGSQNKVNFQGDSVEILASDITYSDTLPGPYQTSDVANPATSKYVKCTLPESGIAPYFMQVLGFGNQTVRAMGVAFLGNGQLGCAIPLGMCKQGGPDVPDDNSDYGLVVGQWYSSKSSPGGGGTGSFDWIDFSPTEGGGANELSNLLNGSGECNLPPAGTPVGEQGQITSLDKAWNSRFGIYKGGQQLTAGQYSFSGFAYTATTWTNPEPQNAFNGVPADGITLNFVQAEDQKLPYQPSDPMNLGSSYNTIANYNDGALHRRVVPAPIVDCSGWAESNPQSVPVLGYACILMLHPVNGPDAEIWIEYRGRTNVANSPCLTPGLYGGNSNGPLVPVLAQ